MICSVSFSIFFKMTITSNLPIPNLNFPIFFHSSFKLFDETSTIQKTTTIPS